MRKVGSGDEVKIAAFVKRLEQQAAHRIVVGKDGKDEERENLGDDVDSGSPQTLVDFIRWAKAKAPADRYALVDLEPRLGLGPARLRRALHTHVKARGRRRRASSTRASRRSSAAACSGRRWRPR